MPRPTTKSQLLTLMAIEHEKLDALIEFLPEKRLATVCRHTEWSILDVLAHLSEWERMVMSWYAAGLKGKTPTLPADGYTWAQLPALNKNLKEMNRKRPAKEILRRYNASFRKIQKTVEGIPEKHLFERSRFAWTNKNNLATYFISCTSSHYVWAIKEIKKCLKEQA